MPRNKTVSPASEPLSIELKRIFSELQIKPWPFYLKHKDSGLKHATLKDAINGVSDTSNKTLRLIAQTLAAEMAEAKQAGLISEARSAEQLYLRFIELQPIGDAPPTPRTPPKTRKLGGDDIANWFQRHFGMLEEDEQIETAPKVLEILQRNMRKWRKPSTPDPEYVPNLADDISKAIAAEGLASIDEYAVWLLEQRCLMSKHPDRLPLTEGLGQIQSGGFPEVGSDVFATTIDYLSHFLGDFGGDGAKLLEFYGILPIGAIESVPLAKNSKSA